MADANTDAVSLDFEIGLMEYCTDHKIHIHLNNINKVVEKEFGILVEKFKKPNEDSASTSTNNQAKSKEAQEDNVTINEHSSKFGGLMFLKTFELNAHNLADTDAIILDLGSDDGLKVIIDYEISKNVVDQTTYHGVLLYCYKLLPGPEMSKKALVVFANSLTEYGSIGHSGDTVTTLSVGNIEEAEYCPNGAFMDISTSDTNNGGINLVTKAMTRKEFIKIITDEKISIKL